MSSRLFADVSTCAKCAGLFPRTADACIALARAAQERATTALDRIRALDASARTFANTADAIDMASAELDVTGSLLAVMSHVSPHKEVRDEAARQLVALEAFEIDNIQYDRRLFDALKATTAQPGYAVDCDECAYWMRESLADYRRRGLELPPDTFDQVVALRKSLAALCTTFSQNISEDATTLHFTADELAGTPASVLDSLRRTEDGGAYVVKMDYPTYFGIMRSCHVAATRRSVARAFCNRAYDTNREVLKEMIGKRHELACLLGYASYAHLSLADKMAKSPEVAQAFVDDLVPKLQAKWATEAKRLKAHLHPSCVLTADAGDLEDYDLPFAINHYKETELHVDENVIQKYFPMTTTVQALFDIYQAFFDITFTHIDNGSELWHSTANTLVVHNKRDGKLLGHIILDLFPRDGKYSHACCHSVVPPVRLHAAPHDKGKNTSSSDSGNNNDDDNQHNDSDGTRDDYSPALAVVLANFPAPVGDRPALFRHDDVQTFFHEFGHAIHGLMGRSRMATFAGTRVKRDFVELPSQMLEEWLWQPDILRRVSRHYRTQQPIPDSLIDAKVRSRNVFSGRDSLRQLQFATYSLALFGVPFAAAPASQLDTTALWQAIEPRVLPGVHYDADSHFECSFGHLTGYGAGYYGYMWSKVFALDLFDYILSHNGLLDPAVGRRYVDCIIGVGGGQDPNDMLHRFLGRPPQSDAFLRSVGVA